MYQMKMLSVGDSGQEHVSSSTQPSISTNQVLCTASGGDLVSFTQEDGIWVATVDKKLPTGFSSRVQLPVCCAAGFSMEALAGYSPEAQRNLIHIERTSGGQDMVYVGRMGLMGGGKWNYYMCSADGCERGWLECSRCNWICYEGSDGGTWGLGLIPFVGPLILAGREIANAGNRGTCSAKQYCERHCTCVCTRHIVLCPRCYACPHCSAKCKQCCGCSQRIAAEKERERKRREEEEREEAERRRREEARNSSYSYSSYSFPSTSHQDTEAERKRKEEEARKQRAAAARNSLISSAMGMTSNVNADTSTSTNTTHTSTVNRKW